MAPNPRLLTQEMFLTLRYMQTCNRNKQVCACPVKEHWELWTRLMRTMMLNFRSGEMSWQIWWRNYKNKWTFPICILAILLYFTTIINCASVHCTNWLGSFFVGGWCWWFETEDFITSPDAPQCRVPSQTLLKITKIAQCVTQDVSEDNQQPQT